MKDQSLSFLIESEQEPNPKAIKKEGVVEVGNNLRCPPPDVQKIRQMLPIWQHRGALLAWCISFPQLAKVCTDVQRRDMRVS